MGKPPTKRTNIRSPRERGSFSVNIVFTPTGETFTLNNIGNDTKISKIKNMLEFTAGIPMNLQRVSYLDQGDLVDKKDVKHYDIVPGGTLQLTVWQSWAALVEAAASNDIEWVFKLGVTDPTDYKTPNSEYMTKRARKAWLQERAFVALCIAAHRGHRQLVIKLIDEGAGDINARTPNGRTALHIAAAKGRGQIIDTLLEKGADIDAEDDAGNNALAIAEKYGYKSCERHLFLFRWQDRAKKSTTAVDVPLRAHQKVDSSYPVWMNGKQSQIYVSNILSPGEFQGTGIAAPRHARNPSEVKKELRDQALAIIAAEEAKRYDTKLFGIGDKEDQTFQILANVPGLRSKPETYTEWMEKKKKAKKKVQILSDKGEHDGEKGISDKGGSAGTGTATGTAPGTLASSSAGTKKIDTGKKHGRRATHASKEPPVIDEFLDDLEAERKNLSISPRNVPEEEEEELEDTEEKTIGALRLYLRQLGRSRYGNNFEDWMDEKMPPEKIANRNHRPRVMPTW